MSGSSHEDAASATGDAATPDDSQPRALRIVYPPELPIASRVPDIRDALERAQVVIVAGATGSGKTTQLPKIALELDAAPRPGKRIGITQPRRIAATSVAARVASELECGLGQEVGYQIRFEDRTSSRTRLKFMTDGILLAEIQGDPLLRRYQTLIIDEAHERSLNIDFLLGWLKRILPERRDLKLLISSATIETARFSEFFDGAPVIEVAGRTYPVEVLYEPPDPELDVAEATAAAVASIAGLDPSGDILVFLPGEREIGDTERELLARKLRATEVLPLFGRLSAAEQGRVFAPARSRRIVLATNVAETSLTIPGIVYVVDTGVARLSRYDPRTGTTRLQVEAISRASADQRKGRCGRVRDGICVRLYEEDNFTARPAFTDPEVRRVGLASVILRMKALRLGEIEEFPFLDAPSGKSIAEGYRVLEELGALNKERELTELGKQLARFPVDPRVARMIIAGTEYGCLDEILVLAAALEIQDPRERPRGAEHKADPMHRRFRDESSDFVGLLKLWTFVSDAQAKGNSHLRRTCKDNYLSYVRIREWREVYRQLESTVREMKLPRPARAAQDAEGQVLSAGTAVHLALLSGLLSRIGLYQAEQRSYQGSRQTRFAIHPGSALAKKPPAWVMAFELVQTSQLFARTVAKIEPEWLDQVAGHLLKRSYSEPHWSEKSGRASVREHATLFGLPVLRDRSVDYATLAPGRARLIFLEHALVRGEYASAGAFQAKNRALLAEVARLRDKARQSDMLADEDSLLAFFDRVVPASVVNGKTFEAWREQAERKRPELLGLTLSDVLAAGPALDPSQYPDELVIEGARLPLQYCFEPGADNDGVTLIVPLPVLPRLQPSHFNGTIPAWHTTKILELLQTLPKPVKRCLEPFEAAAASLAAEISPGSAELLAELARATSRLARVPLEPATFRPEAIPGYLRFTFRVVTDAGKTLAEGRDLESLLEAHSGRAREALAKERITAWQKPGLTDWVFGELPVSVARNTHGTEVLVYPALVDRHTSVELTLESSEAAAVQQSVRGVCRLVMLQQSRLLAPWIARVAAPPFGKRTSTPATREEVTLFRDRIALRMVEAAFLPAGTALPRSRAEFDQMVRRGSALFETAASAVLRSFSEATSELPATLRGLEKARSQPSGSAAAREVAEQLERLYDGELLATVELARLSHYPRYLKAIQVRLARAVTDPRKDADKLQPLAPLWQAYLAKPPAVREQAAARALRFAFEELRVAIFAPELKPAFPVTVATLGQALAALR